MKSRLCARGCFDPQKSLMTTRSTTATRLSQRILVSTAANHDYEVESWDISGAFLKGLTFERVRELLRSSGSRLLLERWRSSPPPMCGAIWRNSTIASKCRCNKLADYLLLCVKSVYGLKDAPLAWQLCLHGHFEETGGVASLLDDIMFIWKEPPRKSEKNERVTAIVTTHVDDCGSAAKPAWLKWMYESLVSKFGKVTRQALPFDHCGVRYSRTSDGLHMSQDDFCSKLKPVQKK